MRSYNSLFMAQRHRELLLPSFRSPRPRARGRARLFVPTALAVLLALAGAPPVGLAAEEKREPRAEDRTDFLRFVDLGGGEGRLETAVVTYVRRAPAKPEGREGRSGRARRRERIRVDLIAAVHIADAAYYRELQRRFAEYDCVLYELVKPKGVEPVYERGSGGLLEAFQRALKDMLDLEFQLEALDYRSPNFVHADLDAETFFRLQEEKGETPMSLFWKSFVAQWKLQASGKASRDPSLLEILLALTAEDSARRLKYLLARQMEGMELMLAGLDAEAGGTVILTERNKAAIAALEKAIGDGRRKLAVFYGAGHMSDLERRLRTDLGFRKARTEWLVAWDVVKAKGEARKADGAGAKPEPETRDF